MNRATCFVVVALAVAAPTLAQEPAAAPAWTGALGLSYVATGGNSDSQTLGLDLGLTRVPDPWGIEIKASALDAESDDLTTAERYTASLRGTRALSDRWNLFLGAAGEMDEFAGFDLRTVAEGGATWKALLGPTHTLSFDGGLTWTREDLVDLRSVDAEGNVTWQERDAYDFMGGVLGLAYAWKISDTASLTEGLKYFPNFDQSSDWRATSETALQAAISSRLALKLGYLIRYDHEPGVEFVDPAGVAHEYDDTDTTTTLSVVLTF